MRSYEIYPGLVRTYNFDLSEAMGFDAIFSPEDDYIGIAPRRKNRREGMCEAYSKATWASC